MKRIALLVLPGLLSVCTPGNAAIRASMEKPADRVVIEKGVRKLTLMRGGTAIRTYKVALGGKPVGPKQCQGDNRTPEGNYTVEARNENSRYHLSLRISYPNATDRAN